VMTWRISIRNLRAVVEIRSLTRLEVIARASRLARMREPVVSVVNLNTESSVALLTSAISHAFIVIITIIIVLPTGAVIGSG